MSPAGDPPTPARAVVVGGGLAGMVAALRLAQRGVPVELHERAERLGGKAGSDHRAGAWTDHGYHVFPAWYHNLWALVDELGIRGHFVPRRKFFRLARERARRLEGDERGLARALRHAYMAPRTLLSAVDLVSRREGFLEELSLSGFLRSRWYNGLHTGRELRDISLKGLGNPAWDVSSLTTRANMRLWLKVLHRANWTALDGSLQERFIEPIEAAMTDAGVRVHVGSALTAVEVEGEGERATVSTLHLAGEAVAVADTPVVLALPHEGLRPLFLPHLARLPRAVQDIGYLRSRPMVAFDVHLNRPVEGLPTDGHVILDGSRHHLTLLDIRDLWGDRLDGPPECPVIQAIAADTRVIEGLSERDMKKALLTDLLAFFPFLSPEDDVGDVVLHANDDAPLFMNDVGTDRRRPRSTTTYGTNLLLAGDWCRTPIDLACMEGALVSGTQAANAILAGAGRPTVPLRLPPTRASAGAWALRATLAPVLWAFGQPFDLYRWLRDQRRARRPG